MGLRISFWSRDPIDPRTEHEVRNDMYRMEAMELVACYLKGKPGGAGIGDGDGVTIGKVYKDVFDVIKEVGDQ